MGKALDILFNLKIIRRKNDPITIDDYNFLGKNGVKFIFLDTVLKARAVKWELEARFR